MTSTKITQAALFILAAIGIVWAGVWYNRTQDLKAAEEQKAVLLDHIQSRTQSETNPNTQPNMDEFKKTDIKVGTGREAKAGDTVVVNYTGSLTNGTVFDSNTDPKFQHVQPFSFTLGAGQVIQGWEQGFDGMKVGGVRELVIPPSLGYGATGAGGVIPPNATLKFKVELLDIK